MATAPPRPDLWTLIRLVDDAATSAVRVVRNRSAGWWRTPSERTGWTRADAIAHLVAETARAGLALEGEPNRAVPPPLREAVLADQLAVVTYDLVLALRAKPDEGTAATALGELLLHTHDVDPRRLPDEAAAAALAVLYAGRADLPDGRPGDVLLALDGGPGGGHHGLAGEA